MMIDIYEIKCVKKENSLVTAIHGMIKSKSGVDPELTTIKARIGMGSVLYKHTDGKVHTVAIFKVSKDKHSGEVLIEPDTPCFFIKDPVNPSKNLLDEFQNCDDFNE